MKTEDLLILGIGALAIYYFFFREGAAAGGGGGGGYVPAIPPNAIPMGGGEFPIGYTTPTKYVVTQTAPTITAVQPVGGRTYVFQAAGGTRAGMITVGTPAQQIEQFQTGPKIIKVFGVSKKVM